MAAHITWNGHIFGGLESGAIREYSDFAYSISTKTKAADGNGVLYIGREGYNAARVQLTIKPRAALGQDVEAVIQSFSSDSRSDVCARMLIGGRDLFGAGFMLTGVDISEAKFHPKTGQMLSAQVKLTWQESDGQTYDNTDSDGDADISTSQTASSKGKGSKYLKNQSKGGEVDAVSSAAGKSSGGGNLTGMVGGYSAGSNISSTAKKQSSTLEVVKKTSSATGAKTTGKKKKVTNR